MTPVAKRGLLVAGGFIVLVAAMAAAFVTFDSAAARGVAIGVGLGIVNLVLGLLVTRRSMQHGGMSTAMATIAGGFGARLVLLVVLFLVFQHSTTVSAAAFGLSFVAFFFVYLALEIVMVERFKVPGHA
jgi:zinc transporter ZupT